jgi:hypothetical protein
VSEKALAVSVLSIDKERILNRRAQRKTEKEEHSKRIEHPSNLVLLSVPLCALSRK